MAEDREWRKQAFLDWLCTIHKDRNPPTYRELAEQLGVGETTLHSWKRDPDFLERWEYQYRRTIGSPEKMHEVLHTLYETAIDRTDPRMVAAAREYRQATEAVRPQKVDMTIRKDLAELTDEEIMALGREFIAKEMEHRDGDR